MIGSKVRENLIRDHWEDILRIGCNHGHWSHPAQSNYAQTRFLSHAKMPWPWRCARSGGSNVPCSSRDGLLTAKLQRRTQIGLNKGEAHHALKNALRIGRQGEIRDRSSRAQDDRSGRSQSLGQRSSSTGIRRQLGKIIAKRRNAGIYDPEDLLSHVSPLGWAHILITGEYRWPKTTPKIP